MGPVSGDFLAPRLQDIAIVGLAPFGAGFALRTAIFTTSFDPLAVTNIIQALAVAKLRYYY